MKDDNLNSAAFMMEKISKTLVRDIVRDWKV